MGWLSRIAGDVATEAARQAASAERALAQAMLDLVEAKANARQWERHASQIAANANAEVERADKRYADLLARFTMLRMNGATEPPPARMIEPVAADPVVETINALAPDAKVRGAMLRQVAFDRTNGVRDDEIIQRIRRGHRPAEEVA